MNVVDFQNFAEEVEKHIENPSRQEEKIIQIVDLGRFIDQYKPSLKIVDCVNYQIQIVEDEGVRKGIQLFDLNKRNKLPKSDKELLDCYKTETSIEEIWLVLVEEKETTNLKEVIDYLEVYDLKSCYDKILYFHFSKSTIHELY